MKKPFDHWLDSIDDAAEEADLDGRSWNPRRDDIKDHLSKLIHNVSNDSGQEFALEMIDIIKRRRTPSKYQIRKISQETQRKHSEPAGTEGKYSLYRDDNDTGVDN